MRFALVVTVLVSAWLSAAAITPFGAAAHFGGEAYILVPADHVNPGDTFEVIAADLTPNATVSLTMLRDATPVSLGQATADAEGHFTTSIPLPSEYPAGYAQLIAVAQDGTQASTWVLVGSRTSATPPPPGQPAWWADPSVIVLGIAVLGGAGVLGYALIKRRQEQRVAVAPVVSVNAGARRQSSRKAERRGARRGQG